MNRLLDRWIAEFDTALRVLATRARNEPSDMPGRSDSTHKAADTQLTSAERDQSARLMRINHSGEIAAQALYRGQAFVTRNKDARSHDIVEKMRDDEQAHQNAAVRDGGAELPEPAKRAMQGVARIMTGVSYWI